MVRNDAGLNTTGGWVCVVDTGFLVSLIILLLFGEVEADLLAVSKITLEVKVLDYIVPTHVISDCAANGERFLDSLALCAEYFFKTYNDSALAENISYAHEFAIQSAEKAGGEKYVDFYQLLLGDW